ncbi:MAG: quinol:cytochrome C oxidoreductase [Myxococcota bacterium]
MSHHEIEKPTDITIPDTSLFAKLPVIGGVLAVVGLGATLGSAMGADKARAMFSYLWAFEAVLALALGAFGWLVIDITVRSQWSIVVRRIAETLQATLPIFFVLWLPIALIGMHELYPWTHETDAILERKRWFLSTGFWWGRAIVYFVVWAVLSRFLYTSSVKLDTLGDNQAEKDKVIKRTWAVAAPAILLYALTQSFAAVDWMMSLQPHWYSTIFGVYYFASSMVAFFSVVILISMALQRAGVLKTAITPEHFHDLGKFTFGFTVFWAYIAFSQFILIWYANIPEETEFYMVRMEGGWQYVSYALPVLHFFLPFLYLLSRQVKRARWPLALGACWMLLMHLLDMYWLILPNYGTHGEGEHHAHLALSWLDFAAILGMAGAFLAAFGFLLKKNKVLAINDPRLPESLAHENY